MFFVVFESTAPLETASASAKFYSKLQPILKTYSGFIQETPFSSITDETSEVLIARFEDEAAAVRWRNDPTHLRIQKAAREKIFSQYRVRVGNLIPSESLQNTPQNLQHGAERLLMVLEQPKAENTPLREADICAANNTQAVSHFATYENDDLFVHLVTLPSRQAAERIAQSEAAAVCSSISTIQVSRDYSAVDRHEARQ